MRFRSIPEAFAAAAQGHPEHVLFNVPRSGWVSLTYRHVAGAVAAEASRLLAAGLARGDRAGIIAENRPEWCVAYLAIVSAGGVAVPVDAQLGVEEVSTLFLDAGARFVYHSEKTASSLEVLRGKASPNFFSLDAPGFGSGTERQENIPPPAPGDLASIIYTSGTTGRPKGVMLTHRNFCSDAEAVAGAGIVSADDNVLSVLPLHHTYAFMSTFLLPAFLGASVTYPASLKGTDLMEAIREREVSIVIGVPQLLALIRNGIMGKIKALPGLASSFLVTLHRLAGFLRERTGINAGRLIFSAVHRTFGAKFRYFASGGARLDPAVMRDLEALGFTVLEGYGLTETSPVVTFNPPRKRKPGSAGSPLPSVELRISNPSGSGEGEIEIRGPMVMAGYYKNEEATAGVLREGWFRTGDLGHLDSEGYLFITGRSKEVIVLSTGKNIYPEEVEKHYSASGLIKEICVTGLERNGITESLHGVIVPDMDFAREQGITNIHEAIKWEISGISSRIPSFQRITGFTVRTEPLPRTPLGKLRRFMIKPGALEERAEKELPADDAFLADEAARKAFDAVRHLVREGIEVRPDDNLELDLGFDSLLKIELAASIERAFGTSLPEDFLAGVQTVRDLAGKLKTLSSAQPAGEGLERTGWRKILSAEPAEMISLDEPAAVMLPSRLLYALLRLVFRLIFRLEARGLKNIPQDRNFIIAPNHTSYLDGFVVILSLPFGRFRSLYSLGLSDYFTGFFRSWFARKAHVIPIDSSAYLNRALQTSAYVLRQGSSLSVFPEGGRSFDGSLLEFKKGVGILAVEMDVPVVPTVIEGAFEAFPRSARFPRPGKIKVTFGKALRREDVDFTQMPQGVDEYQHFSNILREKVMELRDGKEGQA